MFTHAMPAIRAELVQTMVAHLAYLFSVLGFIHLPPLHRHQT